MATEAIGLSMYELERWLIDYRDRALNMHACGATCRDPPLEYS